MSNTSPTNGQWYGTASTEQRHQPASSARALRLYVAAVASFPFLLLFGTLAWMATPQYQHQAQFPSFVGLGYGSRLRGADCQVLIDGDSSALTGVNATAIAQRTGLKTCNIAEVAGVKYVNGMTELDDYLAHNRRPRYILFFFVPENLTPPAGWTEVANFEGWFYCLRYHRDRTLLRRMLHHPAEVATAAELGLRTGLQWLPAHALPPALSEMRERNGGRLPEPGATLTHCLPVLRVRAPDAVWLRSLRRTYTAPGTTVLIDVSPEPPCDPTFAFYAARTGPGITDNTLGALPIGDFTDTGRLHTNEAGSQVLSVRLAQEIAALETSSRTRAPDR